MCEIELVDVAFESGAIKLENKQSRSKILCTFFALDELGFLPSIDIACGPDVRDKPQLSIGSTRPTDLVLSAERSKKHKE